jgi:CBS domain-containing protein
MGRIRLGNKPPLTVATTDTAAHAARAMTERRVGAATVMDGDRILGVITERDMLEKVVAAGRVAQDTPVAAIMTSPALSVGLKATVDEAAELMRKHHIRHLVVVDERGRLVGMLALRYLLYELMDEMERSVGDLVGYIMTDGPGG